MRILFCSEGFIIDGVASYNLYLSAALSQAGHTVAVVGRWAGFKGFQKRHREFGIGVIQCTAVSVDTTWLVKQAVGFRPDILISDARRAFPLARRIRQATGAKVIIVFHDPPQPDRTGGRSLATLVRNSDMWISPEEPIYEALRELRGALPAHWVQRPITGMVRPTALPSKEPFQVLCLGRLSRWKSPGLRTIVEGAWRMKQTIPSLRITVVGGGRRRWGFWLSALKANARARQRFIQILGARTDPQPWIEQANLVCAGATAAVEAILSNRPVLAFSGFWLGAVTPDNIERGVATHFGERAGDFYVRDRPGIVIDGVINAYKRWDPAGTEERVRELNRRLSPDFDSGAVAGVFQTLFDDLLGRK